MGTGHSHLVAPPEYEEEPTKDQVHHRHKVLNEIKQKRKLTVDTTNAEPDIQTPKPSPVEYNKYKRRRKLSRDAPVFFTK